MNMTDKVSYKIVHVLSLIVAVLLVFAVSLLLLPNARKVCQCKPAPCKRESNDQSSGSSTTTSEEGAVLVNSFKITPLRCACGTPTNVAYDDSRCDYPRCSGYGLVEGKLVGNVRGGMAKIECIYYDMDDKSSYLMRKTEYVVPKVAGPTKFKFTHDIDDPVTRVIKDGAKIGIECSLVGTSGPPPVDATTRITKAQIDRIRSRTD